MPLCFHPPTHIGFDFGDGDHSIFAVKTKPTPLILRGQPLPWVSRAEHLGHTLCEDGTSAQDCREKRAQFIDSAVKIRESFDFAHPAEQIMTVDKYCLAAYGSNLWKHTDT